jgi:hypothetical protein
MHWPNSVLDMTKLAQLYSKGISALNSYIYQSMITAAASPELSNEVSAIIRKAVSNAPGDGVLSPRLSSLGIAGADQVAQLVTQVAMGQR